MHEDNDLLGAQLPQPDEQAQRISERLVRVIQDGIRANKTISFARYMDLALYAPGLGYYSGGQQKLGRSGDFVTAPEISSLYSQCIARQCAQILEQLAGGDILEFGAGSGMMAADILLQLERLQCLPERYYILEVSADLRARQQQLLQVRVPQLLSKVIWLDVLPQNIRGVILANEVLDAFPIHRFKWLQKEIKEYHVLFEKGKFEWILQSPDLLLADYFGKLNYEFPDDYESEVNLLLPGWMKSIGHCLSQGLLLIIDYGFPRHEYYHPERSQGTLMCHYRHRAHDNPFILIGLQDMTAHVDFTAVAEAAAAENFCVAGYTNQANFLMSCGLVDIIQCQNLSIDQQLDLNNQIKILTFPSEMGELFKVIALTKGISIPLLGFGLRDIREKLG
jgi:SAM-dependent MidA family methyltransferase